MPMRSLVVSIPGLHSLLQGTAHLIQLFNLSQKQFLTGLRQVC